MLGLLYEIVGYPLRRTVCALVGHDAREHGATESGLTYSLCERCGEWQWEKAP